MRRETRFNGCSPISVDINLLSFGAVKLRSCCAVAFLEMSSPGPSVKKKRRQFSLKEKVDILTELKAGKKQVDICRERDIAPSTVATILKDQEKNVKLQNHSWLPQENACGWATTKPSTTPSSHGLRVPDNTVCPCQALLFKERRDSSRSLWAPPASTQVPDGSIGSGKGMESCGKSRAGKKRRPMPKVRLPGGTSAFRKSSRRSVQTTFSTPTKRRAFINCYLIRQ
ncbi:hypothetical protein HPB50_016334 [Hyalomma asiaticum]|uniref:Uncharacterized protein n=1 Tax=Hyalomma asiaticum TaxID=266040 RepID=A0ACB7SKA3_HYAAI|nr:hypothetical protein HPB50_016334 [Hyalomma asiaticum]